MNSKRRILNIISNAIIVILVAVSIILIFTSRKEATLAEKEKAFVYFTVQSNLLIGLVSLISLFVLSIPKIKYGKWLIVLKMVATNAVFLTFAVVMVYLAPLMGFNKVFIGPNLFMHLITPLLSIANFIILEPRDELKFYHNIFSIIPPLIYGIIYFINLAVRDAYGDIKYDWYMFGKYGPGIGSLAFLVVLIISFVATLALYYPYRAIKIKKLD